MVKRQRGSKASGKGRPEGNAARPEVRQITSEEALKFIHNMQERFPTAPRTKAQRAELQAYLAQFTDAQLKAVGRRVQGDLMLRPARTIKAEDVGPPRPSGSRKGSKAKTPRQRR